jgi:hypothetical protein
MMNRLAIALLTTLLLITTTGCVDDPSAQQANDPALDFLFGAAGGSTRTFNYGNYGDAFLTARQVMGEQFIIVLADQDDGIIKCAPQPIENAQDRLLGSTPTRQVASMQLKRRGGQIIAICTVEQQREAGVVLRQQPLVGDNYSSVPNETPAQIDAATTPEQNDSWETLRTDTMLENQLLNSLRDALNAKSNQPVGG